MKYRESFEKSGKYVQNNLVNKPLITIIIPMYREHRIIYSTLNSLTELKYPRDKLQIILALEPDDLDSIKILRMISIVIEQELNLPKLIKFKDLLIEIVYNESGIRSKPAALNQAIKFARGDIVAIYDAEDKPHPEHPLVVASILSNSDVAAVQFTRAIDNSTDNALTKAQDVEFHIWYDYLEPVITKLMNSPAIAGSAYYIKRNVLSELGFWNPKSPAEDLDLTFRLVANGYKVKLVNIPTKTQAIPFLKYLLRQRSRWIRGALLTIPNAIKALPRSIPLVVITILLPISSIIIQSWPIVSLFVNSAQSTMLIAPLILTILSYISVYGLLNPRSINKLILVALMALINALATWIAVIELVTNPYKWNKTIHVVR